MKNQQLLMMHPKDDNIKYGYLYNWYAVIDTDFAPTDWKVAESSDYTDLFTYLGGSSVAGGKMKETGTVYWDSPNTDADNSSNFTAYGSGYRTTSFSGEKISGRYYTQSEDASNNNIYISLSYNSASALVLATSDDTLGCSVRLLYTGAGTPSTLTDYDGNIYDVIQIGTQYWTKQNWKCTKLNDGTSLTKVTSQTTWDNAGSGDLYYCAYDNLESNV